MGSVKSIRNGRVSTAVVSCCFACRSIVSPAGVATFFIAFDDLRDRLRRMTGANVSGRNAIGTKDTPAIASPIQNAHLQLTGETNPDTNGASCGPTAVA